MAGAKDEDGGILVVDDDAEVRETVVCLLRGVGFEGVIETAIDGEKAVTLLENRRFDLVVCDLSMPRLSGLGVLNYMRGERRLRRTPFLMITADSTPHDIRNAARAGASDFVVKPFDAEVLLERIRRLMPEIDPQSA